MRHRLRLIVVVIVVMAVLSVGVYGGVQYIAAGGGAPPEQETSQPLPVTPPADQLPVTAQDIREDAEGKYVVPDRGDGCAYEEAARWIVNGNLWISLGAPDCRKPLQLVYRFSPDTGELQAAPIPTSPAGTRTPEARLRFPPVLMASDFKGGSDGRYSAHRSDGCLYEEASRYVEDGKEWVVMRPPVRSSTCDRDYIFAPATGDIETLAAVTPTPTPKPGPSPTPTATPPTKGVARRDPPSPSEIKLGSDGKYAIPDRGDGCPWIESSRTILSSGVVDISFTTVCDADFFWTFRPDTGEMIPAAR